MNVQIKIRRRTICWLGLLWLCLLVDSSSAAHRFAASPQTWLAGTRPLAKESLATGSMDLGSMGLGVMARVSANERQTSTLIRDDTNFGDGTDSGVVAKQVGVSERGRVLRQESSTQQDGGKSNGEELEQEGEPSSSITVSPQIQAMEMIRAKMDRVAQRLDRADTSDSVQGIQLDVLAELDRLIAAESATSSSAATQQKESDGEGEDQGTTGEQAADEGGGQTGDESIAGERPESSRSDLLDRAWGHLPDRVRERMQSALGEEFLPKYEKLIEAYYKRLADADQDGQ